MFLGIFPKKKSLIFFSPFFFIFFLTFLIWLVGLVSSTARNRNYSLDSHASRYFCSPNFMPFFFFFFNYFLWFPCNAKYSKVSISSVLKIPISINKDFHYELKDNFFPRLSFFFSHSNFQGTKLNLYYILFCFIFIYRKHSFLSSYQITRDRNSIKKKIQEIECGENNRLIGKRNRTKKRIKRTFRENKNRE